MQLNSSFAANCRIPAVVGGLWGGYSLYSYDPLGMKRAIKM